jgi:hypothetical protein
LTVLLNAGRAQSGEAMLVDRELPGEEFIDGQRIPAASFFQRKQAAADCGNDFRFPADNPPFSSGRWQIRNR